MLTATLHIPGNPKVLSRQPLWNHLLHHYKSHGVLVEGPFTHLKPCMMKLEKPRKYTNRRNPMIPVAFDPRKDLDAYGQPIGKDSAIHSTPYMQMNHHGIHSGRI